MDEAEETDGLPVNTMRAFDTGSTTFGSEGDAASTRANQFNNAALAARGPRTPRSAEPLEKCARCSGPIEAARTELRFAICIACARAAES